MRKVTLLIFFIIVICGCHSSRSYHTIEGFAQGGTYHIIYSDLDSSQRRIESDYETIVSMVNKKLAQIDNSVSGYNPSSTLSKINSNQPEQPDSIFTDLFQRSYSIYSQTEGIFDVTGAPLFDFWGFGFNDMSAIRRKMDLTETQKEIDSILRYVGMDKVHICNGLLIKDDPRIKLNFNAIAQGYSADLIAQELEKRGIVNYLVEIGMEIMCRGINSKGTKWKIGIDAPIDGNMVAGQNIQAVMYVSDAGVVTSGNYRKFIIENGQKYTHTINPVTGFPVNSNLLSATLIDDNATDADAYATYCMAVGLEKSIEFLKANPKLRGYLVYDSHGKMEVYYSDNFKELLSR